MRLSLRVRTGHEADVERRLAGLQSVPYDVPRHGIVGYYPECNGLVPLWHYDEGSKVPAAKSVPVRISRDPVPEIPDEYEIPMTTRE